MKLNKLLILFLILLLPMVSAYFVVDTAFPFVHWVNNDTAYGEDFRGDNSLWGREGWLSIECPTTTRSMNPDIACSLLSYDDETYDIAIGFDTELSGLDIAYETSVNKPIGTPVYDYVPVAHTCDSEYFDYQTDIKYAVCYDGSGNGSILFEGTYESGNLATKTVDLLVYQHNGSYTYEDNYVNDYVQVPNSRYSVKDFEVENLGRYWYVFDNVDFADNETKNVRFSPKVSGGWLNANFKYSMLAKRSSDTWTEAITYNRFVALDPAWIANSINRTSINITNNLGFVANFTYNVTVNLSTFVSPNITIVNETGGDARPWINTSTIIGSGAVDLLIDLPALPTGTSTWYIYEMDSAQTVYNLDNFTSPLWADAGTVANGTATTSNGWSQVTGSAPYYDINKNQYGTDNAGMYLASDATQDIIVKSDLATLANTSVYTGFYWDGVVGSAGTEKWITVDHGTSSNAFLCGYVYNHGTNNMSCRIQGNSWQDNLGAWDGTGWQTIKFDVHSNGVGALISLNGVGLLDGAGSGAFNGNIKLQDHLKDFQYDNTFVTRYYNAHQPTYVQGSLESPPPAPTPFSGGDGNTALKVDRATVNDFNFSTSTYQDVAFFNFTLSESENVYFLTAWSMSKIAGNTASKTISAKLTVDGNDVLVDRSVGTLTNIGEHRASSLPVVNRTLGSGEHNVTISFKESVGSPATTLVEDFDMVVMLAENSFGDNVDIIIHKDEQTHASTSYGALTSSSYDMLNVTRAYLMTRVGVTADGALVPYYYLNDSQNYPSELGSRSLSGASDSGTISFGYVTNQTLSTINYTLFAKNSAAGTTTANVTTMIVGLADQYNNTINAVYGTNSSTGRNGAQSYSAGKSIIFKQSFNVTNSSFAFIEWSLSYNATTDVDVEVFINTSSLNSCSLTRNRDSTGLGGGSMFGYGFCNVTQGTEYTLDMYVNRTATIEVVDEGISVIDASNIGLFTQNLPPTVPLIQPTTTVHLWQPQYTVNCSGSSDPDLDAVTYQFWVGNATNFTLRQNNASTSYHIPFDSINDTYLYNCRASDGTSNSSFTASNTSFVYNTSSFTSVLHSDTDPAASGFNYTYSLNVTYNPYKVIGMNATWFRNGGPVFFATETNLTTPVFYNNTYNQTLSSGANSGYTFLTNDNTTTPASSDISLETLGGNGLIKRRQAHILKTVGTYPNNASFDCAAAGMDNPSWWGTGNDNIDIGTNPVVCALLNNATGNSKNGTVAKLVVVNTSASNTEIRNYTSTTWDRDLNGSRFNISYFIPFNGTDFTLIYSWNVTALYDNGTSQTFTYAFNHSSQGLIVNTNCNSSNSTVWAVANLTLMDEANRTLINGDIDATLHIWIRTNDASTNVTKTLSLSGLNQTFICIQPQNNTEPYLTRSQFQYVASGYDPRDYYLINSTWDNITDNIELSLLQISLADNILHTVQNEVDDPLSGFYIFVQRYFVGENVYKTVAMMRTNEVGEDSTFLRQNDVWYRYIIQNDTSIVFTSLPRKIQSTSLFFTITSGSVAERIGNFQDISYILEFNNGTDTVTATYTGATNNIDSLTLVVNKLGASGSGEICRSSDTGDAATLTCNIGTTSGVFIATLYANGTDVDFYIDTLSFERGMVTDLENRLGRSGLLFTLFLAGTIVFAGLWSPVVSVALLVLALVVTFLLGLINVGSVFILTLALLSGLLIWGLRD